MGLTPTSDKRLKAWVMSEINKSADHRNKHMLILSTAPKQISKQTALTGQLFKTILLDDNRNKASGVLETNRNTLDKYLARTLYARLLKTFSDEKKNKATINELANNLIQNLPIRINMPLPASMPTICLSVDKDNYKIKAQQSNTAVAIIKNHGPIGKRGDIPDLDWILQSSYLASIYPVTSKTSALGNLPHVEDVHVDIPTAMLECNGNILRRMPIYERMAWLTSNIEEINKYYPNDARSINHRFKTITFTTIDQHEKDGLIESYDVSFGSYGGQYRNHVFHKNHPEENLANDKSWHGINDYQGATEAISTLKRYYKQMLNHDPQLKVTLEYTKQQINNEFEY